MMKLTMYLLGLGLCAADLRMASQPRNGYKVISRRNRAPFQGESKAFYMEPSTFNYAGLKAQRDGGGYDNFLRSNIDNEQDKRAFNNEPGKDHLPFRSYEGAAMTGDASVRRELPPEGLISAQPGTPVIVPLRWNNPHQSELEVNVWVMNVAEPVVVPIRKPTCSGEGHKDNVFTFTVPTDFNNLGSKVPGFTGCKQQGDCILQVYAHSVETRQYAMGTPLIVEGAVPGATARSMQVQPAGTDVGLNLDALTNSICMSSSDPAANIQTSIPRRARLISDVANHAYQNSDYSPYSGQQPEAISRNLQAAAIIKMVTGNRGELGKAKLKQDNPQARRAAARLRNKSNNLIQNYETTVNNIIGVIGNKMKTRDRTMPQNQQTENCFRCLETGSVTTQRQTTNTYVPSFQITDNTLLAQARNMVPNSRKNLIDGQGRVLIYEAVLKDLTPAFEQLSSEHGLNYLGPVLKNTMSTMKDATNFRKRDRNGNTDGGYYAATRAARVLNPGIPFSSGALQAGPAAPSFEVAALINDEDNSMMAALGSDMDGLMMDSSCDDDSLYDPSKDNEDHPCSVYEIALFKQDGSLNDNVSMSSAAATSTSWLLTTCAMFSAILLQRN